MHTSPTMPALFISSRTALSPGGGGVQICTREYMEVLRAAGFDLTVIPYQTDRRPLTRLRRWLRPRPYSNLLPPELTDEAVAAWRRTGSRFVFLNQVDLAPLALALRERLDDGGPQIALLSHGLESVDYFHSLRVNQNVSASTERTLGQQLLMESAHRRAIDCVVCLAPFEVEIERWLGARKVDWLPRTVPDRELDWQPNPQRLGCVSTVDHPPNAEGLTCFLKAFERVAPPEVKFRLVGGPLEKGRLLAERFRCVEYLGPLDEAALTAEVVTWSCFVHPLFCYAHGCSTKLAVALGWRLPVATTPAGMRGYIWREGSIPTAESPKALAALALSLLDPATARAAREQVRAVANSSPTLSEVAGRLEAMLFTPAEGAPLPAAVS